MITVRSAVLTHFEQVARECGLDAQALVAQVGLPTRCLTEPDLAVSADLTATLLEVAAERAHEPAFGLRMAASRRLSNLGPLGLLLRDQPTLREVVKTIVANIHTHNAAMTIALVEDGAWVSIREETLLETGRVPRQATEMAMATTFRVLEIFLGEGWHPKRVTFRHRAPTDTQWHRKVFGCQVSFSQEFNDIVCSTRDLETPNPGADPVMARYSKRLLETDGGAKLTMSDRVRQLMVLLLPRGRCRIAVVAQHLGVDRRTVSHHLAAEGTTFSQMLVTMRRELLARYVNDGSRSLSEVAALLGFSELSAFSRWHRQQFGFAATERSAKGVDRPRA